MKNTVYGTKDILDIVQDKVNKTEVIAIKTIWNKTQRKEMGKEENKALVNSETTSSREIHTD